WNGTTCVAQTVGSCVAPMVCNAATSTCEGSATGNCVAPMIWNGTSCVASTATTCVAPSVPDGYGGCMTPTTTTCVAPSVPDGYGGCMTPTTTTCVAPSVPDGYGGCMTPTATTCVAPSVPDGYGGCMTPTTTTCVAPMIPDGAGGCMNDPNACVPTAANNFCGEGATCTAPMVPDGAGGCMNDPNVCVPTAANNFCGEGATCAAPMVPDGAGGCMNDPNACVPTAANNMCVDCTSPSAPDGNGGCTTQPSALTNKLATPGFAPDPAPGKMYDTSGAQVPIPLSGYRHVGYVHSLLGISSTGTALNEATNVATAPDGAVTSFKASPVNGSAVSGTDQVTLGLGNAIQMDLGADPVSGMSWGRWQGNWVTSNPALGVVPAGAGGNLHWFVSPRQTEAIRLPVTGTISYRYAGGTTPTDNYGTSGTLTSATLNANFTAQQVNVSIGVSMPASAGAAAVQLNAAANNVPILPGANFNTTNPIVTCTGCATPPTGVISGQFSQGGVGAGVGYGLLNGAQIINGAAVFNRGGLPNQ
ncbi:MAG: hypothetical protein Q8P42_10760, partial [Gallionella sp.]|nr:hypothetical protein [Gallionella sp.]